jgi:SOS-response transcriptional repressor LexA
VPIIGYITAGIPVPTEQQDLGKIPVSKLDLSGVSKMSGVFGLIVSGDSLIGDEIQDRYTVIVDPNPDIIDGKIYIVKVGTEYVARHLHRENGYVILTSSNGKYEKMQVKEVEIKGRVVLSGTWKRH